MERLELFSNHIKENIHFDFTFCLHNYFSGDSYCHKIKITYCIIKMIYTSMFLQSGAITPSSVRDGSACLDSYFTGVLL